MIERALYSLLAREPFLPFRIKLVNGDAHDVAYPNLVALLADGIFLTSFDGHWVEFPFDRIASIESLVTPLD